MVIDFVGYAKVALRVVGCGYAIDEFEVVIVVLESTSLH